MFLCSAWPSKEKLRIVENILVKFSSSKFATESMVVCLRNLGVISLFNAAMLYKKVISIIVLNILSFYLKSYIPFWSISCLKYSMGGWAPYFSFTGMLKSSTYIIILLFLGPMIFRAPFLSSFDSTCSATCLQVVFELKTTETNWREGLDNFVQASLIRVVLPVPVGPLKSSGSYWDR